MAFLGHFIVGLSIILPLFFFYRERFNHKVAAIFVISNWIGPDSAQAYFFLKFDFQVFEWDFHYLLPFAIWAVLLAFFFSYLSRFSIVRSEKFLMIQDDMKKTLDWKNAYFIVLSGGIIHTITDTLTRSNLKIKFFETFFEPTLFDIQSWGTDLGIQGKQVQLIAYLIMIVLTFLLLFIFQQKSRDVLIYFISLILIIIVGGLAIGDGFLGGEYDIGTVFFSIIFIFTPLMLLMYVFNDVHKQSFLKSEIDKNNETKTSQKNLFIVSGVVILLTGLVLALGILSILQVDFIIDSLNFEAVVFTILGIALSVIGSLGILSGIGLMLRLNVARYITMVLFSLLLLFVFPLTIVFYLAQNDVKYLFHYGLKKKKIEKEV
ncbi:MAG: hypothetical protein KGD64_10595 [Candidatus Heimdallarchaeota archaeon]|nr:hypothetical protein [Candidatus Heimdallarchaeota archaeon]